MSLALTPKWNDDLKTQAAADFILLPAEARERGYNYNWVAQQYLIFLKQGTRKQKLSYARKFFKFLKQINRDRAKKELGEDFFEAFEYFWENFKELNSQDDWIKLESIDIISELCSRYNFALDIVSSVEMEERVKKLDKLSRQEETIDIEFEEVNEEYLRLNREAKKSV